VVDDVITTGASMSVAALLLRERLPGLDIVAAALAVRV
jgi:orotate phosphoribosyltransferase